jgi:hypothetical protein
MILKKEVVDARLNNPNNLAIKKSNTEIEIVRQTPGPDSHVKIPEAVRDLLTITSSSSPETATEVASNFDISQTTVSNLRRGLVGNRLDERTATIADKARRSRQEELERKSDQAHDLALDSLVSSLKFLQPRIEEVDKPEKLASMAASISKVVSNISGVKKDKLLEEELAKPRVVLFAPIMKPESSFESIEVS